MLRSSWVSIWTALDLLLPQEQVLWQKWVRVLSTTSAALAWRQGQQRTSSEAKKTPLGTYVWPPQLYLPEKAPGTAIQHLAKHLPIWRSISLQGDPALSKKNLPAYSATADLLPLRKQPLDRTVV